MTEQVLFRAGRALVVTLSALTLAHLLELSHRLAYDTRLWAHLDSPDARYRYLGAIGGLLEVATVVAVTVHAMTVGWQRPGGRFALTAAVLHTAAVGVWLGVVLPAGPVASDRERWRVHWETGHAVSFGLLLLGFGALVLAVLSERYPRDRSLGAGPPQAASALDRRPARPAQLVLLGPGTELSVTDATPGTRFLLMTGQPYGEAPIFSRPHMD